MAHFAKLDSNNIVTQVVVVNNEVLLKADGVTESEYKGKTFLNSLFGSATWVQTSFNNNFRKQFAGVGYEYNEDNDVFIRPQPYASWTLDSNHDWQPPVDYPSDIDTVPYQWNEDDQTWDLIS